VKIIQTLETLFMHIISGYLSLSLVGTKPPIPFHAQPCSLLEFEAASRTKPLTYRIQYYQRSPSFPICRLVTRKKNYSKL